MFDAIGGYFELECGVPGMEYHDRAEKLNTGRNCLEYIMRARLPKKIYVPYYTCDVVMDVLGQHPVEVIQYHIDEALEPKAQFDLHDGDRFLYINYFGLKSITVASLAAVYGDKLIVDNSQAFFSRPIMGIDTFYSARKFFGVADGSYLYTNRTIDVELERGVSYPYMMHLLKRIDVSAEAGFETFTENEDHLKHEKLKRMSRLTEHILKTIDYMRVMKKRIGNYILLDTLLAETNEFHLHLTEDEVPMVYPYLCSEIPDRRRMSQMRIYTAQYWKGVLESKDVNNFERNVAERTLFCPIDQRYDEAQIRYIAREVRTR
jgi:hypothetical protein